MTAETWRVGRKLRRTLYVDDQVVGMVDTPDLAARIVAAMNQGSVPNPSPTPAAARDTAVPGVEVGTVVVLDLDGVRDGHVPWPGDADDGTCSCCGMPHPCVTRRLADEVDTARAEIESWKRCARTWKPGNRALIAQAGWAEARAENAEAQVAVVQALHFVTASASGGTNCGACSHDWPCPTLRALDGAARQEAADG